MTSRTQIRHSTNSRIVVKTLLFFCFYVNIINMEANIKDNLSKNIIKYRKALSLTQAELAEKLNYSDKAVSKWERGEAVPDICVVSQLADFFGVSIDTLISTPKEEQPKSIKNLGKRRIYIGLWSLCIVWLVASLCYACIDNIIAFKHTWLFFVYAGTVSFLVVFILTSVWGKTIANMVLVSLFIWTLLASIYITLAVALVPIPPKLWELFIIGVPLQGLLIFIFLYKKAR